MQCATAAGSASRTRYSLQLLGTLHAWHAIRLQFNFRIAPFWILLICTRCSIYMTMIRTKHRTSSRASFFRDYNWTCLNGFSWCSSLRSVRVDERHMWTDYKCGSASKSPWPGPIKLTSGMTTCLGVVHNECQRLRRGLLLQPEPSMIWVIGKIIHLSNRVGDNSICGNQILGVDWATVTQGEGTIFKQRI
jgi:hypothetical protein